MRFNWRALTAAVPMVLALLLSGEALGQSVPNPSSPIAQGITWTPAQWITAFQSKVDVTSGSLTNPTITGGTISNASYTGTMTGAGLTALFAAPSPIGSTTPSTGAFTNLSSNGTLGLNGWVPAFGVRDDSTGTPAAGGSGYNPGEVLTLNDGCATHAVLVVADNNASNAAITSFNVGSPGVCAKIPSNPVSVLSSTGSGTAATFTLSWAPIASALSTTNALTTNRGNLTINGLQTGNYQGGETTRLGYRAGYAIASGDFDTIVGHDTVGSGGGCTAIYVNSTVAMGTDALRNSCGNSEAVVIGAFALQTFAQTGTSGNSYLFGTTALGPRAMNNFNGAVGFPWDTAIGDSACRGATSGTISFTNGTCLGTNTGIQLTTASNFLIVAGGGNASVGATNFASGTDVALFGTGANAVDTPAAGTSHYMNLFNIIVTTGIGTPLTSLTTIAGELVAGGGSQFSALNLTTGFFHFPYTNATSGAGGIPTGTPASINGDACVWNDVTFTLNCYSASAAAWKHQTFSASAG